MQVTEKDTKTFLFKVSVNGSTYDFKAYAETEAEAKKLIVADLEKLLEAFKTK